MAKEKKKTPKTTNDEYIVTSDAEAILYGLLLILLGAIGLINTGPIGHFITYIAVYLFGVFYSLFFILLMILGLYLIVKKKFLLLKVDVKVLGVIFLLFAFILGASLNESLTIQNCFSLFNEKMSFIQESSFYISDLTMISSSGGGIVGYIFIGLFNSMFTAFTSKIIIIVVFVLGIILLFKDFIVKFFKFIVSYSKNRKAIREKEREEKSLMEAEQKAIEQIVKTEEVQSFREETPVEEKVDVKRVERRKPTSFFDDFKDDDQDDFSDIVIPETKEETVLEKVEEKKEETTISETRKEEKIQITSFFEDVKEEEKVQVEEKQDDKKSLELFSESNERVEKKTLVKESVSPSQKKYVYPPISLLTTQVDSDKSTLNSQIANEHVERINELFEEFNIGAQVVSYTIGPSVTRFDVARNAGVKLSQISGLQNELAQKLGGNETVRVELIVQGKTTSGIEVGNVYQTTVSFKECFQELLLNTKDKLLIPLGKDISGKVIKTSIDELPHLLVAGTTGSGKSVFVHSIIMSLIMRNTPDELRILLIDPKKVEFAKYHDLPHLLCPIISDNNEAVTALKRLVDEMERRYEVFATKGNGATKYSEYMEYAKEHNLELMPNIVMIVDEFADFISYNQKDVEQSIQRIAQKARACGIYMVLATQRPSVSVISGNIKANIPSRVALSVTSSTDSRVILDETGAETLIGKGDLLAKVPISKSLLRVQSSFISNKDIMAVCDFIRSHSKVNYYAPFLDLKDKPAASFEGSSISSGRRTELDPLHEEVKAFVIETKIASTSKIQNTFQVGFSRADYILDCLEREGVVKRLPSGRRIVIGVDED